MKILIVNGPNLNLLGKRKPEVYGTQSFSDYIQKLEKDAEIIVYQSNREGDLIDTLHNAEVDGIVLNAGGYTHTSVALRDAVEAIDIPVVEVHISNITEREEFRHTSLISPVAVGCIFGFGIKCYSMGIDYFLNYSK